MNHPAPHESDDGFEEVDEDELAATDWSEFEPLNEGLPDGLRLPADVLQRMTGENPSSPDQLKLFHTLAPDSSPSQQIDVDANLWSIVIRAYADVRERRSIDFVIANPEANASFVRRCWELGAASTSPFNLNWMLLNSRKNCRVQAAGLSRSDTVGMRRERLDEFAFAADIAMRRLQDRLYVEQREASIDHILCEPHLAREFDSIASELALSFTSFEFRWAALSLRKARRLRSQAIPAEPLVEYGYVEQVKLSKIAANSGIYAISVANMPLFVGVAEDMRRQLDALIQTLGTSMSPDWAGEPPCSKPMLFLLERSIGEAEQFRSSMLNRQPSRFNHRASSLFVA